MLNIIQWFSSAFGKLYLSILLPEAIFLVVEGKQPLTYLLITQTGGVDLAMKANSSGNWPSLQNCRSAQLGVAWESGFKKWKYQQNAMLSHIIFIEQQHVLPTVKLKMKAWLWWNFLWLIYSILYPFLAATKQLYKWYFPSVCLSVRLSVRLSVCPSVRPSVTPFWLCSPHRIIMKFSGVITNDKSKVHAKGQGQRSKVKVTEVTTQLNRFRTVTPVWILIWWWNDAYSLMLLRRGALLFFKVIRQISRSHSSKNRQIWPRLGVSGL